MGWRRRRSQRPALGLSDEEVYGQLEKPGGAASLFLWRFSPQQLSQMLERAGILPRLRCLGYPAPRILVAFGDSHHLLRLEIEGEKAPLMDLRLSEESRPVPSALTHIAGEDPMALLVIQWVSIQHVRGQFSEDRPRLPGQSYPGLGLGRRLYRLLWRVARELGKDAVTAYPMYYHNAVYYSAGFAYLEPRKQGELLALRRDLAHLPLKEASEGIRANRLRDGLTGHPVEWGPGEMFASVSRRMGSYFTSRFYGSEVRRFASELAFRLEGT